MGSLKTIRARKMIAQGGLCYYCNLPMWDDAIASDLREYDGIKKTLKFLQCTAEHLRPLSDGGANTADNIVAACRYCNTHRHRRKRPRSPDAHRQHVQKRMADGRWLAARFTPQPR